MEDLMVQQCSLIQMRLWGGGGNCSDIYTGYYQYFKTTSSCGRLGYHSLSKQLINNVNISQFKNFSLQI